MWCSDFRAVFFSGHVLLKSKKNTGLGAFDWLLRITHHHERARERKRNIMGQKHASRVMNHIGEGGSTLYRLGDVEYTLDRMSADLPSIDFKVAKAWVKARRAKDIPGAPRRFRVRNIKAQEFLDQVVTKCKLSDEQIENVVEWCGRNKCFTWRMVKADIDFKKLRQDSKGQWVVTAPVQGHRFFPGDLVLEVSRKPITGLPEQGVRKILGEKSGDTCLVRTFRSTESKLAMYDSLRMPPPCTKIVLWDMDQCMLNTHTGGITDESPEKLSKRVTEATCYMMARLAEAKIPVGVVTFSDQRLAKKCGYRFGGEALVRPLVHHALKRHWHDTVGKTNLEEATQRGNAFAKGLMVRAALPKYRNENIDEKETPMPNNKEWHIEGIKSEFKKRTGKDVKNEEIVFFDDGRKNVDDAIDEMKVMGVLVNELTGFAMKDWNQAMDIAWEYELTGEFNA